MEEFLNNCGLSEALDVFTAHEITMEMLNEMTDDLIKELLPIIGHRIRLKCAIKQRQSCPTTKQAKPGQLEKTKAIQAVSSDKEFIRKPFRNDPEKKKEIITILHTDHRRIAELYEAGTDILIEKSLFSFEKGCHGTLPGWKLINFDEGVLMCPLCNRKSALHFRRGRDVFWQVHNFKRHVFLPHQEVKCNDRIMLSDDNDESESIDINALLEIGIDESEDIEMLGTDDACVSNTPEVIHPNDFPESSIHNPPGSAITVLETTNDFSETIQERTNTNEILILQQQESEVTASMIANPEEEEVARTQSEFGCQSKQAEELAQQQHIVEEDKNQIRLDEEKVQLLDKQKKAEELLLLQAIKEAKQEKLKTAEKLRKESDQMSRPSNSDSDFVETIKNIDFKESSTPVNFNNNTSLTSTVTTDGPETKVLDTKDTCVSNPPEVIHPNEFPVSSHHNPTGSVITVLETTNDFSETIQERSNTNEIQQKQESEVTAAIILNPCTTEEEPNSALIEGHRIACEVAVKQSEMERQSKEAEQLHEQHRIVEEEENQKRLWLLEKQKKAEELFPLQAIEEVKEENLETTEFIGRITRKRTRGCVKDPSAGQNKLKNGNGNRGKKGKISPSKIAVSSKKHVESKIAGTMENARQSKRYKKKKNL